MPTSRNPLADARRPDSLDAAEISRRQSGRGRTVLVVEDSDVIRRVLTLILEAEGYRVVESAAGGQAVALAQRERPDVITLDLSLPDVDGREILRLLRSDEQLRSVPVVVVSAFTESLSSCERWLASDVIVKPFDLDDLLARLDRAATRSYPDSSATVHTVRGHA